LLRLPLSHFFFKLISLYFHREAFRHVNEFFCVQESFADESCLV
jgi:hypothetical protein